MTTVQDMFADPKCVAGLAYCIALTSQVVVLTVGWLALELWRGRWTR